MDRRLFVQYAGAAVASLGAVFRPKFNASDVTIPAATIPRFFIRPICAAGSVSLPIKPVDLSVKGARWVFSESCHLNATGFEILDSNGRVIHGEYQKKPCEYDVAAKEWFTIELPPVAFTLMNMLNA
jgi:hypothetical protein